jgi:hypothetical protein
VFAEIGLGMFGSFLINLLSAKLGTLTANRVKKQKVIDALKQAISHQTNTNTNIDQFKSFLAIAVQNADIDIDYTIPFDQLIQELDNSAALSDLLKMALYPPDDLQCQLEIIAQKIEPYIKKNNISIPSELGVTPCDFVNNLYQLIRTFIELIEPEATLSADIKHLKTQLAKPLLPLCALPKKNKSDNFIKFKYDRQLVSFRQQFELKDSFEVFLNSPQQDEDRTLPDIKIITLHGQGGVGKSRVAFELCLVQKSVGWHAGFLNQGQHIDVLSYRWDTSSLIVFDYAAERLPELITLVDGLQARFSQTTLHMPVRIMLLERQCSTKTGWFKQLNDNPDLAQYLPENTDNSAIAVTSLTDEQLLSLTVEYLSLDNKEVNQHLANTILQKAKQIEKAQPRPLIIQLIAELYLKDEMLSYGSIETLLEALFQRECDNVKKLPFGEKVANEFWQVLAVATLTGGFEHKELKDICQNEPFKQWYKEHVNQEVHSLVIAYFGEGNDASRFWFGLEPDLLGEYLVLRHWRIWQEDAEFQLSETWKDKLQSQLALALALNDQSTKSLARLCSDFTKNNLLLENEYYFELQQLWLRERHPQSETYTLFLIQYFERLIVTGYTQNDTQDVWDNWQKLLKCYLLQPLAILGVALARMHIAINNGHLLFDIGQMEEVITNVLSIAEQHKHHDMFVPAAQGLMNFITAISEQDNKAAQRYTDKLLALAELAPLSMLIKAQKVEFRKNNELWLIVAKTLMNLITTISKQDSKAGQHYADELLTIAEYCNQPGNPAKEFKQSKNPEIWLIAAKGLMNLIMDMSEQDSKAGKQYTDKLLALAEKCNQPEIWLLAAGTLMNLIMDMSEQDSKAGKQYADKLLTLTEPCNQPEIWLMAAKGLMKLIASISKEDSRACQQYVDKLLALAEPPIQPSIWTVKVWVLIDLISDISEQDNKAGLQYADKLLALAEQHIQDAVLLEAAKRLTNLIPKIFEQDNKAGQQFTDKLLALAEQCNQPNIWLVAAKGLTNLVMDMAVSEQDNKAGLQYADKLLALAEKHKRPAIWLLAAKGLMYFISNISEQHSEAGQQYIDKLLTLAEQRNQHVRWLAAAQGFYKKFGLEFCTRFEN